MRSGPGGRAPRTIDNMAYTAMLRRMIRGAGRRVGDGDLKDLVALQRLRDDVDLAMSEAVAGLRGAGYTWQEIGDALGTTRQAAIMRWVMRA